MWRMDSDLKNRNPRFKTITDTKKPALISRLFHLMWRRDRDLNPRNQPQNKTKIHYNQQLIEKSHLKL
ncbi:hypothetical protein EGC77_16570 [Shewanella psychromarinicola]|uniref:Uncharacterized protein n=1 Tax=Shewanella psychromarinicola TaxID=2487742 RepID=A0A3N4DP10_9GAMM|nr:hypothetical protein EGC77_16570 [Shewanella psychromarinicola]